MFGIGTGELLLIFFVVFLIYGPKRLPELAQKLGKVVRDLKKASDDVSSVMIQPDPEKFLNTIEKLESGKTEKDDAGKKS